MLFEERSLRPFLEEFFWYKLALDVAISVPVKHLSPQLLASTFCKRTSCLMRHSQSLAIFYLITVESNKYSILKIVKLEQAEYSTSFREWMNPQFLFIIWH